MSDTNAQQEPTEAEIVAELARLDADGVPMPSLIDGPTSARVKESNETEESEEKGQSEETESPEAGTEPDDTEETEEEEAEETDDEADDGKDKTEEPELKEGEQKPQTKAEKEQSRFAKNWQKLEAEKAEIAKQREEIERARAEITQAKATKPEPVKDEHGNSAEDYERFANEIEKEIKEADARGETPKWTAANVELARVRAQGLRQKEEFAAQERAQQAANAEIQQALKEYPELQKHDSPLSKAVQSIFEKDREFYSGKPGAMLKMAELAAARVKADSVPVLEKKIAELTKENQRLVKLTSPSKGGTSSGPRKPAKAEPTESEIEAQLAEMDRQGVALSNI